MEITKKCLNCGKKIIGRSDKKYCDMYCRNSYNNKIKNKDEQNIIKINSILRKNRKILKTFNREGKTTIRTEFLRKLDFNFYYHTHTFTTNNNIQYKFCYEYGYTQINNIKTLIVVYQKYMRPNNK
ncbi:MAG: hypothetical protein U9R54_08530 [Bacteroidota bacterium]|nr:hypothetical protein [Bacteroidota bacterium]